MMERTRVHKKKKEWWNPIYYRIWNKAHPNDQIKIRSGCVIHHIDGNHENNSLDNLMKMTSI